MRALLSLFLSIRNTTASHDRSSRNKFVFSRILTPSNMAKAFLLISHIFLSPCVYCEALDKDEDSYEQILNQQPILGVFFFLLIGFTKSKYFNFFHNKDWRCITEDLWTTHQSFGSMSTFQISNHPLQSLLYMLRT